MGQAFIILAFVQLFYLFNDWAGRSEGLDATLRFFYVCAVPLLATLLASILMFAPRMTGAPPRSRVALAALIAIALCVFTVPAINFLARTFLDADVLSPRPFVTHRVNLLVLEPNDSSFPAPEVMLLGALSTLLWAAAPRLGAFGWIWTALYGLTRIICGSNYVADSAAGAALGFAWGGLSLAACSAPLHFALPSGGRAVWKPKYQVAFCSAALLLTCAVAISAFSQMPRFSSKFAGLWGGAAKAAPSDEIATRVRDSSTLGTHEGEGVTEAEPSGAPNYRASSPADTSKDQHRSDYIPKADLLLRSAWAPLNLPHRILSIDVAQVRAGDSAYRSAMVRFIVENRGPDERMRVFNTATNLIRTAFHQDAQLQNIDVLAVMPNAQQSDFGPRPLTTPGPLPVFSASVSRKDLSGERQLPPKLATANPGAYEPEAAWLRARSLIYINDIVLPTAILSPQFTIPK